MSLQQIDRTARSPHLLPLPKQPIRVRIAVCGKAWAIGSLLAFGLSACSSSSPESVVEAFYRAMERGQIDVAMRHLSSSALERANVEYIRGEMTKEAERLQACGGIHSIETAMEGEGDFRHGRVKVTFHENCWPRQSNEKHRLVLENGAWKLAP